MMVGNVVLVIIIGISAYSWWTSSRKKNASGGKSGRKDHMDLMVIFLCIYLLMERFSGPC